MKTTRTLLLAAVMALATMTTAPAAEGPPFMNYQGVLRDSGDNPLDGSYDMVLRFYSGTGEEILIDRHTSAQGGVVTVSGGLFNVPLGAGSTADGSGPGTYGSLIEVFRDYNEVYLEVQIGADAAPDKEILSPRTRVMSAAYALNANNLSGLPATSLLRSNDSDAYTWGTLTFSPGTTLDLDGTLNLDGAVNKATTTKVANFNADLLDSLDSSAFSLAGHGHVGGEISGPVSEASNADTLDALDASQFLRSDVTAIKTSGDLQLDAGVRMLVDDGTEITPALAFRNSGNTGIMTTGANDLAIVTSGTTGLSVAWNGDTSVTGRVFVHGDGGNPAAVLMNATGPDASQRFYFWEDGDAGGESLSWDDPNDRFSLTDELAIQGPIRIGSTTAAAVGHNHVGWGAPDVTAEVTDDADVYITDDLEVDGHLYLNGRIDLYAPPSGSPDPGNQFINFYDDGLQYGEQFRWDDADDRFFLTDDMYFAGGVSARGAATAGGYFETLSGSGHAWVGHLDEGISAHGTVQGGYFQDDDSTGKAHVAYGDLGIEASGMVAGGHFVGYNLTGQAYLAYGDRGIEASGSFDGGFFYDSDDSGRAWIGQADYGIWAEGNGVGGYFKDRNFTGDAYVGYGNYGIYARGHSMGGFFSDNDHTGTASVAYGNRGIWAKGTFSGGTFTHPDNVTFWADVATPTHKISGTGVVSFVQNHPYDENKVLVYAAPEGDEVAVYTRGTARLVAGEATVALGETFKWVANPDVGLTAQLTPHGDCLGLYVAALGSEELVVRELGGGTSDIVFDYIVYGLRIGFEELAVVETKQREALLPAPEVLASKFEADPRLRDFSALQRFKSMTAEISGLKADQVEMHGAAALRDAILASGRRQLGRVEPGREPIEGAGPEPPTPALEPASPAVAKVEAAQTRASARTVDASRVERNPDAPGPHPLFPVSESVEPGDLLVLDPEQPGQLRRCTSAADVNVIGIVAGDMSSVDGSRQAPVALSNLAVVKVDAGFGVIRRGDLLMSSFTPGHAMRAHEVAPGTIVGKALDPLDSGTGTIRVLVMQR